MSNRTTLLRMMFLVTFIIIILIMYSVQLSKKSVFDENDPIFKETIILKNQEKAYSILLHSVKLDARSIIGYSGKFDSMMTFPSLTEEINVIQNKLNNLPYKAQDCNVCHQDKWK